MEPLARTLAGRLVDYRGEIVCGPLIEGAFIGLMVASALGLPFAYSEPRAASGDARLFPVSYPIAKGLQTQLMGRRVLVVNDVINAGSAVRGTLASLKAIGAEPVGIGCLAVLGDAPLALAASADLDLEKLASFSNTIWEPTACPLCAEGAPPTRLSRGDGARLEDRDPSHAEPWISTTQSS